MRYDKGLVASLTQIRTFKYSRRTKIEGNTEF